MTDNKPLLEIPDSILLVDKKTGISSFDVIRKIKFVMKPFSPPGAPRPLRKIGHAGTLDPIASGLVIVLLNGGTKRSDSFLTLDKTYEARLFIGSATDSYDSTGTVTESAALDECYFNNPERLAALENAINSFTGEIMQEPPMFSALKKDGQALYKLARAGVTIEREKRRCVIYSIEKVSQRPEYDAAMTGFHYSFTVRCSKGTYIRSLCRDIGTTLGIPCHMSGLRRTSVGPYEIDRALAYDDISAEAIQKKLIVLPPREPQIKIL